MALEEGDVCSVLSLGVGFLPSVAMAWCASDRGGEALSLLLFKVTNLQPTAWPVKSATIGTAAWIL
jgi:hypothetical protein